MMFEKQLHDLRVERDTEKMHFRGHLRRGKRMLAPKRLFRHHPYATTSAALIVTAGLVALPFALRSRHAAPPRQEKPGRFSKLFRYFLRHAPGAPLNGHAADEADTKPHKDKHASVSSLFSNLNRLMELLSLLGTVLLGYARKVGPTTPAADFTDHPNSPNARGPHGHAPDAPLQTANVGTIPTYDLSRVWHYA